MSMFKHPVGGESSRTYWRRRIVFLLGLAAVLVVVLLIVVKPGSGSADEKSADEKPSASTPQTTSTPSSSSSTIPSTDAAAKDGAPCKPGNVAVQAITDSTSYGSSELPQLSLSVTNTGKKPCTIEGGTADQLYTITSGTETYWKSTDCQKDPQHTKVLLSPGTTVSSEPIPWDRTRSEPETCDVQRPPVTAGGASYHLSVEIGGVASKKTAQFLLY